MSHRAEAVIVGAGIGGCAVAWHLAVRQKLSNVVIVDELVPLTLTSDKGTQGYRNWWPGPDDTMLRFVSRSIDLMEELARESFNIMRLSRRGYLFVASSAAGMDRLRTDARRVSAYGMGEIREHDSAATYSRHAAEGFEAARDGADVLSAAALRTAYPWLAHDVAGALHVRRAGWLNAVAMGQWSLNRAFAAGARFVRDAVTGVDTKGGRVNGVMLASGRRIETPRVILATGPRLPASLSMLDIDIPLVLEFHAKSTFRDVLRVVPRDAPFVISTDPVTLRWSEQERGALSRTPYGSRLLGEMPGGIHIRPVDGPAGDELYLLWTFDAGEREVVWPPAIHPEYEISLMRGLPTLVPGMQQYDSGAHRGYVDGGYYCKTLDNRPLAGPLEVEGAYICAALSGFGVMSCNASAELVAAHVTGAPLPDYADAFHPARVRDPAFMRNASDSHTGQL